MRLRIPELSVAEAIGIRQYRPAWTFHVGDMIHAALITSECMLQIMRDLSENGMATGVHANALGVHRVSDR